MRAPLASRLRLAVAATLLALAGGIACTTPSVPLPPPLITSLSFQPATGAGANMVVIQGMPTPRHANVRFYVFNRSNGDGVITKAGPDGAFTTSPFPGVAGDTVQLYYDTPGGDRSDNVCTTLAFNTPLVSSNCL
jgi:hypothetical protein